MQQVLTLILPKDKRIEEVRKKYFPEHIEPHITLVYPFEFGDQKILKDNILDSIKNFEPFEITLDGLQRSSNGYYLYLLVDKGRETILKLHEKLNSKIGSNNPDMPEYVPHLSIGKVSSGEELDQAIGDIPILMFKTRVETIQLLTIKDDVIKYRENIYL